MEFTWCCLCLLTAACLSLAQEEPRILSPPQTMGAYLGQTAFLKCSVANLGSKMVTWTLLTHNILIFEGGQLLYQNVTKYSLKNTSDGQGHNLQISNIDKFDQGFYQCAIEGTDKKIITHLNVLDVPKLIMPQGSSLNVTDCCIMENVTESCLPSCYPSQIDLDRFNATEKCGTVENLKGLSKCFTGGSNHDNCCLSSKVDSLCLGFCHNAVPSILTPDLYTKCFTDEVIHGVFTCFEMGFELLPSEPTEVTAMAYYAGSTAAILVKWAEPKKNPQRVTGYLVMHKPNTRTSYSSILIKDVNAYTKRLIGHEFGIQPDMSYKIRVSALAEHGVSFGSVEVDIYFPASSVPGELNSDIDTCCSNRSVDEKCRNLLCHSKTWSKFNTDEILTCFPYLNDVFTCLVGERNHTNCCSAFDVTYDCLPLCSGQPPPLSDSLIGCVSQMSIIEACVQQGYTNLPAPPTQVTIKSVESTSAIIQFQPIASSTLSYYYLVELKKGDENAPFEVLRSVEFYENSVQLSDLTPNTYYWFRMISVGVTADSLPSETVAFLTYPEDYDITQEIVTNIPHNMTDCCISSGMPEICWRGCEYRTNITSYYKDVLFNCLSYIGNVLACAADGRDHSECCKNRGVQPICVPLCAHTKKGPLDEQFHQCISDTAVAIVCYQEGIVNLPRHPDVVVFNVSKNSISLKWEQPKTSGLIDSYIISYVDSRQTSQNHTEVSTSKTFYILQNLRPGTQYEISVTSSNSNGTSAPSPVITQYTLSDDIQTPPTFNKTEVPGRTLWQNISHCCKNNFQGECLKQCLNEQTAYTQQTTCIQEGHKMLACFADGKDHRLCCEKKSLPSACVPICGGQILTTDVTMATCMSYDNREIILSCFLENQDLTPGTPNNFGAKLVGTDGSVRLQWTQAGNCNADCTYGVHYWKAGEGFGVNSHSNTTNTSVVLKVEIGSFYTFTVIAHNIYGSSSPAAWQTLYITKYERNVNLILDSFDRWVEKGQSANFICEKIGFDPDASFKIEWFFNNNRKLENDEMMELLIPNVDPIKDEGEYTCTVTDSEIASSASLFLPIKYVPKFSHFEEENAEPGKGQSAKIDCLFQGIPDSDPNKWLIDQQPISEDNIKYTMSEKLNYDTGLTTYSITITDVVESDYGTYSLNVSNAYGNTECQMKLTNPTLIHVKPSSGQPDFKKCCVENNVSTFCQEICGFHNNITNLVKDPRYLPCLEYFKIYLTCGADGRDHTKCCQKQGLLPMCIPLCKGEVPAETSTRLLECVPGHTIIFSCAQQGHLLLPHAPEDVTLTYRKEDGIISVRWKEPHLTADKVDHYNIYYNFSGNPGPRSVSVNQFVTEYYIKNVQPQTVYNVWMTAGNENGSSLATAIQVIDTSIDSVSVIQEEQKNSQVAVGIGITVAVVAFIAIIVVVIVFIYRSRLCPLRGNSSVTFENQGYGNPGQIKIEGVGDQYSYGRLQDGLPEGQNTQDSSSSAADSSFENPMFKQRPQPSNSSGAATLPVESHS